MKKVKITETDIRWLNALPMKKWIHKDKVKFHSRSDRTELLHRRGYIKVFVASGRREFDGEAGILTSYYHDQPISSSDYYGVEFIYKVKDFSPNTRTALEDLEREASKMTQKLHKLQKQIKKDLLKCPSTESE